MNKYESNGRPLITSTLRARMTNCKCRIMVLPNACEKLEISRDIFFLTVLTIITVLSDTDMSFKFVNTELSF